MNKTRLYTLLSLLLVLGLTACDQPPPPAKTAAPVAAQTPQADKPIKPAVPVVEKKPPQGPTSQTKPDIQPAPIAEAVKQPTEKQLRRAEKKQQRQEKKKQKQIANRSWWQNNELSGLELTSEQTMEMDQQLADLMEQEEILAKRAEGIQQQTVDALAGGDPGSLKTSLEAMAGLDQEKRQLQIDNLVSSMNQLTPDQMSQLGENRKAVKKLFKTYNKYGNNKVKIRKKKNREK